MSHGLVTYFSAAATKLFDLEWHFLFPVRIFPKNTVLAIVLTFYATFKHVYDDNDNDDNDETSRDCLWFLVYFFLSLFFYPPTSGSRRPSNRKYISTNPESEAIDSRDWRHYVEVVMETRGILADIKNADSGLCRLWLIYTHTPW